MSDQPSPVYASASSANAQPALLPGGDENYDAMTDDQYMEAMERKVAFYKQNYPDMYKKAEEWIAMLDHSQVYKEHGATKDEQQAMGDPEKLQALDLLKNMRFHGMDETDITEAQKASLDKHVPDWKFNLSSP